MVKFIIEEINEKEKKNYEDEKEFSQQTKKIKKEEIPNQIIIDCDHDCFVEDLKEDEDYRFVTFKTCDYTFFKKCSCGLYYCGIHFKNCEKCGKEGHYEKNQEDPDDCCFEKCQFCKKIECSDCISIKEKEDPLKDHENIICPDCLFDDALFFCVSCLRKINHAVDNEKNCPFEKTAH